MQRKEFKVFADYRQFYLWDKGTNPEAPMDYTDLDIENRIKIGPNVLVIQPERDMEVNVAVEIHAAEPTLNLEEWDHVAEASLHLPTGQLEVHECTGGPVADFLLVPGWYRARSFHGGFKTIDPSTLDGNDYYLIVLWPEIVSDLRILKQWGSNGAI